MRIKKICLSGEDSVVFVNSLFRPPLEAVRRHDSCVDAINKNIIINYGPEGLEANIADLDLSFLNEEEAVWNDGGDDE